MENCKVTVNCVRRKNPTLLCIVCAIFLAAFCHPAWATVTATITQGYPQASPGTVNANQDSTLSYNVTITGLNANEGISSQIKSEDFVFTVTRTRT